MNFARMMMLGIAGIVLLVVVLNVSAMMLVRSAMRERDLAVRSAMGASRWRLMQYHLAEATVLALLSGGFASAVVFGAPVALAWAFDASGPWLDLFRPDFWLALQVLALCGVTSVALGLLPALRFSGASILGVLKSDSSGGGRGVGRQPRVSAGPQGRPPRPVKVRRGVPIDQGRGGAH